MFFKGNVSIECPPGSSPCADALTCIKADLFCDGEVNCPDGSDEDNKMCGKFSPLLSVLLFYPPSL